MSLFAFKKFNVAWFDGHAGTCEMPAEIDLAGNGMPRLFPASVSSKERCLNQSRVMKRPAA